ncbi:MAG: hypothetical protein GF375_06415 [Candidatus Omnitrophica bacterium]|nr:hypothetical protein [Candidatus Omnitrophota bacterium]MBD3269608.1 hypothetical protein [Candidatus Omnitrophota bacterium]
MSLCQKASLLLILFLLVSCQRTLNRNEFLIAGTYLEIISPDPRSARIVYEEFLRLDKIFNKYDPDSEISRLNKNRSISDASDELIEVLELSAKIGDLTSFSFDITCAKLYDLWKDIIGKQAISFPHPASVSAAKNSCCKRCVDIDEKNNRISLDNKNTLIDLGGIAKGYMVDEAVERLKEEGITSALINAGGDIYCLGKNRGKLWSIGIKDPEDPGRFIKRLDLSDAAVATSGDYEQFFEYKGNRYSHLINPRTGYPADSGVVSVTVVGRSCAVADSLATAVCIDGMKGLSDTIFKKSYASSIFIVKIIKGEQRLFIIDSDSKVKRPLADSDE